MIRAAAIAVLIAVCAASSASAAPWKRVTTPDGASTDQVGLARTADGVLHLVWSHPTGPNTEDLHHTVITRNGRLGATTPIQSGWTGFTNAALVVDPGGLRAFWGGFRTTDSSDPHQEMNTAALAGRRRELGPPARLGQPRRRAVVREQPGGHRPPRRLDAAGLRRHARHVGPRGPLAGDPQPRLPGADSGSTAMTRTSPRTRAGRSVMAWYSNASGHLGVLAQDVSAGRQSGRRREHHAGHGRHAGSACLAARRLPPPRSEPRTSHTRLRTRSASGESAPETRRLSGASAAPAALRWPSPRRATGACGSCGRRASATRTCSRAASNVGARKFGAVRERRPPEGHHAGLQAGRERRWVGRWTYSPTSTSAPRSTAVTSHRRILPGLTLRASPGRVRRGEPTEVRFTVLDAGDPVQGARVTAGGRVRRRPTRKRPRGRSRSKSRRAGDGEGDPHRLRGSEQSALALRG